MSLDLRAGPAEHFEENAWAASAKQVPAGEVASGIARYEIPAGEWLGKFVILSARVVAGNGKAGAWSKFVIVPVVPAPQKPAGVKAVATSDGVRVTWRAEGSQFRVFRKPEGATEFALGATVD